MACPSRIWAARYVTPSTTRRRLVRSSEPQSAAQLSWSVSGEGCPRSMLRGFRSRHHRTCQSRSKRVDEDSEMEQGRHPHRRAPSTIGSCRGAHTRWPIRRLTDAELPDGSVSHRGPSGDRRRASTETVGLPAAGRNCIRDRRRTTRSSRRRRGRSAHRECRSTEGCQGKFCGRPRRDRSGADARLPIGTPAKKLRGGRSSSLPTRSLDQPRPNTGQLSRPCSPGRAPNHSTVKPRSSDPERRLLVTR